MGCCGNAGLLAAFAAQCRHARLRVQFGGNHASVRATSRVHVRVLRGQRISEQNSTRQMRFSKHEKPKLPCSTTADMESATPKKKCRMWSLLIDVVRLLLKKLFTLLDLCVSSLRRGHANLLCIVPILTDDPRRESVSL